MRRSSWVRYGFARLRPLSRPLFWAPSIALLFLVLFAWEFFSRPELASYFGISEPNETLSREDQAIGADIDSLPLLMNDIRITPKTETTAIATPQNPDQPNLSTANRSFSFPTTAIVSPQPNSPQSNQGVFGVFKSALTTELGLTNVTQSSIVDPSALPPNRLQEAISKLAAENRAIVPPIEGTSRADAPLSNTSINSAPLPNSFSTLVEGTQPIAPGMTPTSPPLPTVERGAGIAPLNLPLNLPLSLPLNAPVPPQSINPQFINPQPSEFGVIQNAPVINQQPFGVPRPIPGRSIGGGNINTFSNP